MARLPTVGGDYGNWGTVLNEYLRTAHNTDGTLRADVASIAALKALNVSAIPDKMQVMVGGYYEAGDGGGVPVTWQRASLPLCEAGSLMILSLKDAAF